MRPRHCSTHLATLLLLGLAAIVALTSCRTDQPAMASQQPSRPARINHVVFFKLNDPADTDALIADCDTMLARIPGIVSYYAGRHIDTGRATVDSNYDVGFYAGFMDEVAYATYIEHPSHIAMVEKWRPKLQWLRVYDVLDDTP